MTFYTMYYIYSYQPVQMQLYYNMMLADGVNAEPNMYVSMYNCWHISFDVTFILFVDIFVCYVQIRWWW